MIFNINDHILINNQKEWYLCQNILFDLDHTWYNGSFKSVDNTIFPVYIILEKNHRYYTSENLMFDFAFEPHNNSSFIINFSDILKEIREQKLKRIV